MKILFAILLAVSFGVNFAEAALYRIKGRIDTKALLDAGLINAMDYCKNNGVLYCITHSGDLKLQINDMNTNVKIMTVKSDSNFPVFTFDKVYETNSDYLSIGLTLVDRDYLWISPWSWGKWGKDGNGLTDDKTEILSLSIVPGQNFSVDSMLYTSVEKIRIMSSSENAIHVNRTTVEGKLVETRTISNVVEYQDFVNSNSSSAYNLEITRLQ